MMDVLECEVCLEEFDSSTRKPKLLSCGHTICLMCVMELHRKATGSQSSNSFLCPKCRRETRSSPNALIDNFYIISMIQDAPKEKPKPTPVKFWCLECNEVADRTCEEKHTICRLQKHRGRELKEAVDLLERGVSVRLRLTEMLREVDQKLNGFLGKQADEFAKHQENTQTSLSLLYDSLELVGPEWEKASAAIEEARQSCAERLPIDEQSLDFLRSARRCEVTVHGEEGTTWCGDLNLQQRQDGEATAVVLGLLSTMQRAKLIRLKSPPLNAGKEAELPRQPESKNVEKLESSSATQNPISIGLGALTEFASNTVTALSAIRNNAAHLQQHRAVPEKAAHDEAFWDALLDEPLRYPEHENGTKLEIETIGTLDVTVLSRTTGKRMEKDALLLNCNPAVKLLRGLQCGIDPAWACALLGVLGRQLEALEMVDAHEEHLHAVTAMPRLRRLRVQSRDFCPSAYNGCTLPGPAKLQDLELDVPLRDIPIIFRICGGGVPTLRMALVDDADPDSLRSVVTSLREVAMQRRVLEQWSVSAGGSPAGLRRIELVQRQSVRRQQGPFQPTHPERCVSQLQVFSLDLPGVQIHCKECGNSTVAAVQREVKDSWRRGQSLI